MVGPDNLDGQTIFVVEDDYMIAHDLVEMLRARGAAVLGPVASVEAAVSLMQMTPRIDGALLDVNLQGKMAFAVADALTARDIPFVFATGYDMSVMPVRFAQIICCEKPFDLVPFVRMLAERRR